MARAATVAIGVFGTREDAAGKAWRPTLDLCSRRDAPIARLELLHGRRSAKQVAELVAEVGRVSPHTEVKLHVVSYDPWRYEQVFAALQGFAAKYAESPGWRTGEEDYLVHVTTGSHAVQTCWFLLVQRREIPGVLVQTLPPENERPRAPLLVDLEDPRFASLDAARLRAEEPTRVEVLKGGVATRDRGFDALVVQIERAATNSRDPILLLGPTGSGKTELARQIFEVKKAGGVLGGSKAQLGVVNCAALQGMGNLLASELFGHARGSFTGADRKRDGVLKSCDGGVLFLDEVGTLDGATQALLLKALEEKRFRALGSDRDEQADFQLVSATNADLHAEVAAGRFRSDLLARIDHWMWRLPSLRDRLDDVEPLLERFLNEWGAEVGSTVVLDEPAKREFVTFARSAQALWAGNLRDLRKAVRRMASEADRGRITKEVAAREVARLGEAWRSHHMGGRDDDAILGTHLAPTMIETLDPVERPGVAHALRVCAEARNQADAGRQLFLKGNPSDRISKYLARYGVRFDQVAHRRK